MNRFLRIFVVCTLLLWAILITIWLTARTIVAVASAKESWQDLTWREADVTDTSVTSTLDTVASDTLATDTMATDTTATAYRGH